MSLLFLKIDLNGLNRFEKSVKEDMMHFLVASALKLSAYGKLMLLSLLKGVGSEVMLVEEVELLLNELLNRRHQFHLGNDQLCMKISKIEVDTMCLFLEVIQFQVTMMMALLLPWSLLLLEVVPPSQKRSSSILCLDFELIGKFCKPQGVKLHFPPCHMFRPPRRHRPVTGRLLPAQNSSRNCRFKEWLPINPFLQFISLIDSFLGRDSRAKLAGGGPRFQYPASEIEVVDSN
ncbi:hypothetical protein AgCh_003602 [Apium graveolens]